MPIACGAGQGVVMCLHGVDIHYMKLFSVESDPEPTEVTMVCSGWEQDSN